MTLPLRGMLAYGFDADTARASALREASDDELIGELARRGRWLLEQPEAEREREDRTAMERQAEREADPVGLATALGPLARRRS